MGSTNMLIFSTLYLIIFGLLAGLAGVSSLSFSTSEFVTMIIISGAGLVTGAVAASAAAGIGILGSGSPEAGRYIWRGMLFAMFVIWVAYFVYKIMDMLPPTTPVAVSALLLAPPIVGIIWGMFTVWHKSMEE